MRFELDENLVLKQFSPEDAAKVYRRVDGNRDHLRQWLPWVDATKTESDSLAFIESTQKLYSEYKSLQCGIWYKGEFAGAVGHHRIFWLNKWVSIGYWLGKEFEGKGIMTRSVRALVDHSFKDLKLNCVEIAAAVENSKSRSIPERLGFKHEGVLRQREWLYDHFVDHAIYSMLSSDWN